MNIVSLALYNRLDHVDIKLIISSREFKNIKESYDAYLKINCCKIHSRRISFNDNLSCEIGDLIFVIDHELIMASVIYRIDRKVTIT